MSDTRFHGIYPSTVLPMRADFAPDWDGYAAHTAHCVMRPGIRGVLINGHAGENYVITRAEKRRAVEVTRATLDTTRLIVAGVNAESSQEAAEEARDARAAGADDRHLVLERDEAFEDQRDPAERVPGRAHVGSLLQHALPAAVVTEPAGLQHAGQAEGRDGRVEVGTRVHRAVGRGRNA